MIHMLHTQQQEGNTWRRGGIFATTPHHAMIILNRASHQGCQGTDTSTEPPHTTNPFHYLKEPIRRHQYIGKIIEHNANG